MIVGITVSKTGEVIQRLPVATKLAIGLAPSGEKRWPERLDHFLLLKRGPDKGSWVPDAELMAHYAPKCKHEVSESCADCCRTIKILLLDDDLSNVFPHELAWWARSGKKCWGDGEKAMRRKDEVSEAVPWTPCRNGGCPDWDKDCSGSGDLRFCLADYPVLGSISRIHTSSLRSVENIASALNLIQTFTGGRLAGVTVPLCVNMTPTNYMDKGVRKSTVVPILSIHVEVNELVASIKATMELWGTARKAFGKSVLVDDDEAERAAEIPPEFPRADAQKALPESTQPVEAKPAEPPKAEPPKPDAPRPTTALSGGVETKPTETKPAAKVEKARATYEGLPKSIKPYQIGRGPNKGQKYWKAVLDMENGEVNLVIFSSTVAGEVEKAIAASREVQVVCEVRIQADAKAIVAEEISYVAKPSNGEATDDPSWMLE